MKALPLLVLALIVAGCSKADAVPEPIPQLTTAEKQLGELVLIRKANERSAEAAVLAHLEQLKEVEVEINA